VLGVVRAAPSLAAVPVPGSAAAPSERPPPSSPTCTETFLSGADRPKTTEAFPDKGKSGYALVLDVLIEHGKGETVLPSGLASKVEGDEARALARAGFHLPDPGGGAEAKLETKIEASGDRAKSRLTLPVVALPEKPGRNELVLPPLPIAITRASGEVRTLCTAPHPIVIEDPIANEPEARPKGNPRPLRQLEEWTAAKNAAIGAAVALVVAALLALLHRWWKGRPKVLPPPPPPRPPWDVALEELFDVKLAELVQKGRYAEHFDRVSDAVRRYLGARYGFDGLETTTREALLALSRVSPRVPVLTEIQLFLEDADLVKFAKRVPEEAECQAALEHAEQLVRRTMPVTTAAPSPTPAGGAPPASPLSGAGPSTGAGSPPP
jgi:hypothetical protein